MAKIDDITVRICDEDRERLDQLGKSMGWLREHLEEIRTFAQIPAISISSPSDNTAPIDRSTDWKAYEGSRTFNATLNGSNIAPGDCVCSGPSLSQSTSIVWNTNDLPPNTTIRIGDKDYSTICLDCGKPLSECKCSDPRTGIGAVVDQPGD